MSIFALQPRWIARIFHPTAMWHTQAAHGLIASLWALGGLGVGALFGHAGAVSAAAAWLGVPGGALFYVVREIGAHRYYRRERAERGTTYQRDLEVHLWDSRSDAFFPMAVALLPTVAAWGGPLSAYLLMTLWGLVWLNALGMRPHPDLVVDGLR